MILLKNTTYLDHISLEINKGDILVDGELTFDPVAIPDEAEILDCSGMIVTRAFINAHHHAYSALATGMPAPPVQPTNFSEVLKYVWWRLDKSLSPEIIRACGLVTAINCARAGVSMLIDHHASPFAVKGSLDILADAFEEVGLEHLLCYEISDRDGEKIAREGLKETDQYLSNRKGLVGLHASFTVGEQSLKQAVELASKHNSGIHVHCAEDPVDQEITKKKFGKNVISRYADAGVLDLPSTILAHCLHLNEDERALVRESNTWVVQNMESNLNNQVGRFNDAQLGERIMLGTDGMHSDMLRSMQAAYFAGLQSDNIDVPKAYQRMRNVHTYLTENDFPGSAANNLVVLDYQHATPFTSENALGHLLYAMNSNAVRHLIVNGEMVMENRRLLKIDDKVVLEHAREMAADLWKEMEKY